MSYECFMFEMIREADASGVSGTGKVGEGVVFSDGRTVFRWLCPPTRSTVVYDSFPDFLSIHVTPHPDNKTTVNLLKVEDGGILTQENTERMAPQRADEVAEAIARRFHEEYERQAPMMGWETQERSRGSWEDLDLKNRALMVATVEEVLMPVITAMPQLVRWYGRLAAAPSS